GAWSVVTRQSPGAGHAPVGGIVAIGAGLFLIFWLALWTLGGIAAGREVLRLFFWRGVLLSRRDGLEITHSYGRFRSVEKLPREEIRRFYQTSLKAPLRVETTRGTKVLTQLGTPRERTELEQQLNAEFGLQAQPGTTGALPKGWCEL